MASREVIPMKEVLIGGKSLYRDDFKEGYEEIERNTDNYDLEDGYADISIVFKRLSDNKFFKVSYRHGVDYDMIRKGHATEVFPKEVTTTIYE